MSMCMCMYVFTLYIIKGISLSIMHMKLTICWYSQDFHFTQWDVIDITGDMTVQMLIEYMAENFGVELSMLSAGVVILFSEFIDRKKQAERKAMTLRQLYETVGKKVCVCYMCSICVLMLVYVFVFAFVYILVCLCCHLCIRFSNLVICMCVMLQSIHPGQRYICFETIMLDEDGEEVELPPLRYRL